MSRLASAKPPKERNTIRKAERISGIIADFCRMNAEQVGHGVGCDVNKFWRIQKVNGMGENKIKVKELHTSS